MNSITMMGRKRQKDRKLASKRAKLSQEYASAGCGDDLVADSHATTQSQYEVQQSDRVEPKVDIIVKDLENNTHRSLTIWGQGLGIEKTIAVVEELKRNFSKKGTKYSQETAIKAVENDEPHLQVILTPIQSEHDESNLLDHDC